MSNLVDYVDPKTNLVTTLEVIEWNRKSSIFALTYIRGYVVNTQDENRDGFFDIGNELIVSKCDCVLQ